MSTGTATSTGSGNALKAAGVIVLILAGLGFASAQGWISPNGDPSEPGGAPEEEPKLVILTAAWGHFEPGEGTWPDGRPRQEFHDDARDVTITYWVDGVEHAATRDDRPGEPWTEYLALHPGAEVRLLVEQHGVGGFLMCSISANGKVLLPNGYMHRNDAGDCDINGVVP